jgi:hypothetical protein
MFGRTYRSAVTAGKREFFFELHRSAVRVVQMHFRVEDSRLVNLSAPAPKEWRSHRRSRTMSRSP